jgi:hypothetical protein
MPLGPKPWPERTDQGNEIRRMDRGVYFGERMDRSIRPLVRIVASTTQPCLAWGRGDFVSRLSITS